MSHSGLSRLPSVEEAANHERARRLSARYNPALIKEQIRAELEQRRQELRRQPEPELTRAQLTLQLLDRVEARLAAFFAASLRPVLNATGIILHTGLGRAPLAAAARENIARILEGYCNLELDLEEGKRGERNDHVERLICALCGAEAAVVANNNAAAVLLALNSLCQDHEAIISRGQLIEIGGSFRLPDVMEKSGTIMREVGTTNKTHLHDYEKAINARTSAIVVAHTSNYRVVGFTAEPELADIVAVAHRHGIPVIHDLGGGVLVDLGRYGLPHEPLVQESLAAGVDVVTFSGDKVLGGPQCGLIAGLAPYIRRIHANPLMRALRCDKMVFAALEATLQLFFSPGTLAEHHPVLAMLQEPAVSVRRRAEQLLSHLDPGLVLRLQVTIEASSAQAGSGTLPLEKLASHALVLRPPAGKAAALAQRLRCSEPPVLGYIQDETIWLDLRTIRDAEVLPLAAVLNQLKSEDEP